MKILLSDNDILKVLEAAGVLESFKDKVAGALINVAGAVEINKTVENIVKGQVDTAITQAFKDGGYYAVHDGWATKALKIKVESETRKVKLGDLIAVAAAKAVHEQYEKELKNTVEKQVDILFRQAWTKLEPEILLYARTQVGQHNVETLVSAEVKKALSKIL